MINGPKTIGNILAKASANMAASLRKNADSRDGI